MKPPSQETRANLISVHKQDLVHRKRKQHVQEEDLVAPDDPLLLCLLVQPARPLVLDQLVLEAVLLRHVGDEFLHTEMEDLVCFKRFCLNALRNP